MPRSLRLSLLLPLIFCAAAALLSPSEAAAQGDEASGSPVVDSAEEAVGHSDDAASEAPASTEPRRFLLIGDSMAWAIGVAMKPMMSERGDRFIYKSKISASIRGWGSGKKIREQIRRYRPDAVIIVLGTNESQVPHPGHLARPIRRIVKAVGPRACYWVGPPTWRGGKEDTGVVDILKDEASPCQVFDSIPLEFDRRPDGVHPSPKGSRAWAEAIMRWLETHPPRTAGGGSSADEDGKLPRHPSRRP